MPGRTIHPGRRGPSPRSPSLGLALYGSGLVPGNAGGGPAALRRPPSRRAPGRRRRHAARSPPCRRCRRPEPAPDIAFKGPDGAETGARRPQGPAAAGQSLGDLVRALQGRDAGARPLQARARRRRISPVVAINVDTRNLDKPPEWLRRERHPRPRLLCRSRRARPAGDPARHQIAGPADHDADRRRRAAPSA